MPTLNLSDSKQTLLEEVKLFGRFNYDLRDTVVLFIYFPKPQISQPADFSYFFCFTPGFTRDRGRTFCESPSLILLQYFFVLVFLTF